MNRHLGLRLVTGGLQQVGAGAGFIGGCQQGSECAFDITVTNAGGELFEGLFTIIDTMPADWTFVRASAGWSCITEPGGTRVAWSP